MSLDAGLLQRSVMATVVKKGASIGLVKGTHGEDRSLARRTGLVLSTIRDIAINPIRRAGFGYIPDGWRTLSCIFTPPSST